MRVAILNRPREWWPGGDLVEIDNRIAALAKLGVECEYEPSTLAGFDIAHVFHCNFRWATERMKRAISAGLPFVLTPLFYPGEIDHHAHALLRQAFRVLPFSEREAGELVCEAGQLSISVIPNGTSEAFHAEPGPDRAGVCAVIARADNPKNSGLIEYACKLAGLPYEQICGVPQADMPAVYRRFRIFAIASSSERMSLTVGEALCSGCRVFSTTQNRGNEWYGPGLRTIDPGMKPETLAWLLACAYDAPWWDWTPNVAARLLTWDRCAVSQLAVYEEAIRCHASR